MLTFEAIQDQVVAIDENDIVRAKFPYTGVKESCKSFVIGLSYQGVFGEKLWYPKKYYGEKGVPDYQKCGDIIGMSVAKARDKVTNLLIRTYVDGKEKYINRLAVKYSYGPVTKRSPSKIKFSRDSGSVIRINKFWPIIKQYEHDNMDHMAGFAFLTGLDAHANKKLFGKKLWKRLHKNSKTRNDLIVKKIYKHTENIEKIPLLVKEFDSYPSTILKRDLLGVFTITNPNVSNNNYSKFSELFKGRTLKSIKQGEIDQICFMVLDTRNMAHELGEPFNPSWSFRRMMVEHEKYRKMKNERRYSPKTIKWLEDMPQTYEEGGIVARLLTSPRAIAEHGDKQHHCVASYIGGVSRESYIVYEVEKDGKLYTFGCGLRNTKKKTDNLFRHYNVQFLGFANAIIEDKDLLEFKQNLKTQIILANEHRKEIK